MANELEKLKGIYRLDACLLDILTQKHIKNEYGVVMSGASNNEILAMIHFLQICDCNYHITGYRLLDLEKVIYCSTRDVYALFHSLQKKGLLQYKKAGKGCYDLTIPYSAIYKRYRQNRQKQAAHGKKNEKEMSVYLTLAMEIFRCDSELYKRFAGLSRYAKKAALLLLSDYKAHPFAGVRMEHATLMDKMGLKDGRKELADKYIREMNTCIPDFAYSYVSKQSGKKLLYVKKANMWLESLKSSVLEHTYFKYSWNRFFKANSIEIKSCREWVHAGEKKECSLNVFGKLYYYVSELIKKGIDYESVVERLEGILLHHSVLDEITLYAIEKELRICLAENGCE